MKKNCFLLAISSMYFLSSLDLRLAGQSSIKYKLFGICRIRFWKCQGITGGENSSFQASDAAECAPAESGACHWDDNMQNEKTTTIATKQYLLGPRPQPHPHSRLSRDSLVVVVAALPHTQTPLPGTFYWTGRTTRTLSCCRVHQAATIVSSMHHHSGVTSVTALPLHRKKQP